MCKFNFVSKVVGRIVLRINFLIDITQPKFQRRINVVSISKITVQITLIRRWKWSKIRNRIFNIAQHWHNVGVQRWSNVKSTLHNVNATVFQHCIMSFQRCFNLKMTLSRPCVKVTSAIKLYKNQIWLGKSMGLSAKTLSQIFERFWICLWHRSSKWCNFKTLNHTLSSPLLSERWKKCLYIYFIYNLNKITLTAASRPSLSWHQF